MGDGNIYGWHRRGVPIPHVALMCVLLFVFGRVTTSPPAAKVPFPASVPTPREGVAAGDTVDAEALRQRVVAAERERDQYKTLYQERDATLERTRRDAAAATEATEVNDPRPVPVPVPARSSRDIPSGREYENHAHGVHGNEKTTTIDFQVLSWEPHAVLYRNFASLEECDHVKKLAESRLAPSGLALRKGETASGTKDIRTSSGTFLSSDKDPRGILSRIERRMADVTHIPQSHGEAFNVLRYQLGQKYDSHYDTFDPASYGPQTSQRVASFLLYLTDVEEGGETHFPLEGPKGLERLRRIDYKSCADGLHVKPRAGDALLFYNIHPNATFDKHSLHGGCPVVRGEKWVATKWIRDKSMM